MHTANEERLIAGYVTATCNNGNAPHVLELLLAFRRLALGHDGRIAFEVARDATRDDVRALFEIWRSEDAVQAHARLPETASLRDDLDRAGAVMNFSRYALT